MYPTMADQGIKPVKGYVLVKLLEQGEETPPTQLETLSRPSEGVLAQVISAGAETPARAGQTVIMRPYAVEGALQFSNMLFVEGYQIVAIVA